MTITIAGDFATTYRGLNAIERGDAFSEEIMALLKCSNFSIVNLESPVAEGECKPIEKIGPNLRTNRIAIEYLKKSGVDVVTLANNHFFDYGEEGVRQTVESLIDNDIQYVGGGRTEEEKRKVLYLEDDENRVAVLNYCEAEFSVRNGGGSNHIDPICVYHDIQEAKSKASFILVITHGGHEGYNLPSPRMQKLYRFFIDSGANIVVNHHQHCYSGFEEYHGGHVFYGLGNFFFDSNYKKYQLRKWHKGFLLELTIDEKECNYDIIPYIQCLGDDVKVKLLPEDQKDDFQKSLHQINGIIEDKNRLAAESESYCKKKCNNVSVVLSPYTNRYLRFLCKKHLIPSFLSRNRFLQLYNIVFCESHNDILRTFLKDKVR